MRTAALLAKTVADDAQAMPAHAALRAATLAGARALGLEKTIGSIEPGKAADLIALDFSAPELVPCYDVLSHLVYVAGRDNVTHVWVGGRLLLREREFENPALQRLEGRLQLWQNAIKKI
jgi:5-methylthioadenosine/S-adenosylhomocysteine deaminase